MVVISLLVIVWFGGSVIGMTTAAKSGETTLVPILLGQLFAVFGIIGTCVALSDKASGWWVGVIVAVAGFITAGYGIVIHFGSKSAAQAAMDSIPTAAGIGMAAVAGFILTITGIQNNKLKQACIREVMATCVEHNVRMSNGHALICPVYEVRNGDGEPVRYCKNVYSRMGNPEVDEQRSIFIDGEHTDRYVDPVADKVNRRFESFVWISVLTGGIVLTVVSLIVMGA